jgi:hypothetical protein
MMMTFQEQPYPCVHLALDRLQLHHHVSVISPLLPVRALWHPAACLEPSMAPACEELGSTTRAADVGAGFCIILENPSRALAEQDVEGAHTAHTVAAREIGISSCDAQLAAAGTSLDMGMGFGAAWLLEACRKKEGAMHRGFCPWVTPSSRATTFKPSSGPSSCDTLSDNSEPAQHNNLITATPLASIEFCLRGEVLAVSSP